MSSLIKSPDEVDGKVDTFFREAIQALAKDFPRNQCQFIVVVHFVPTFPYFLDALSSIGKIALLVPKGTYRNAEIYDQIVAKGYRILGSNEESFNDEEYKEFFVDGVFDTRRYLKTKDKLINLIELTVDHDSPFLLIDVGGYYSYFLHLVSEKFGARLLGVVEGTENGHQKYLKELASWPADESSSARSIPVVSMARSLLKQTEDYNVGKSIVEAASTILRVNGHTIIERMSLITVIGFGKVGRSISQHLRQKCVKRVVVYDKDPIREMEAVSLGFAIADKEWLIANSDMIFCATGNQSLNNINFGALKNNVFIASCTSNDDEFESGLRNKILEKNNKQYTIKTFGNISQYAEGDKVINLLHNGNTVNFIFNATNGPYIYSVLLGLIVSAIKIMEGSFSCDKSTSLVIRELDRSTMEVMSKVWLKVFEGYEDN